MTDGARDRFLATVETLALKMLPTPLRQVNVTTAKVRREYRFADAPGFRVLVEITAKGAEVGIGLEGAAGEKMYANLESSRGLLEQTLGKGLQFRGERGARWIGESLPVPAMDARVADLVARRLATYILYFKPMMDDLGSRA